MPMLRSERGAALVTALMLTMIALVVSLTLLYVVTSATRITASQRRYRTALAAAHGGVELFTGEIIPLVLQSGTEADLLKRLSQVSLKLPEYACLQQKLVTGTAQWSEACRARASADPSQFPDATFLLSSGRIGERGFSVATKIVDSVPGNSDRGGNELLDVGGGRGGAGRDDPPPARAGTLQHRRAGGPGRGGLPGEGAAFGALRLLKSVEKLKG